MAEKLNRKALRQPDEFQVVAGRIWQWMVERGRPLLAGLAVAVALALAAWGLSSWKESREERAGAKLADALGLLARPIAGDPYVVPGQETFATREERNQAVLDALTKVRGEQGGTRAALTALAEMGFAQLKAGDASAAAASLRGYLDAAGKGEALRLVATEQLGLALEVQGKGEEAREIYGRLAEEGAPARAAFEQGRLALAQKKPEAQKLLEQVARDHPKDPVALEAQQRLEIAALPPPLEENRVTAADAGKKPPPKPPAKKSIAKTR